VAIAGGRVLIVGGSSGVGFAVARLAAEAGAKVIIATSNAQRVAAAVARLPGAEGVVLDVRDAADVARAARAVGALDHLVYTAGDWGGFHSGALSEMDLDQARGRLEVRFWGAPRVIQAVTPGMSPGGSITVTSGLLAHRPQKGNALATAGGGALEHLTRALAVDLAPLRVNCVCWKIQDLSHMSSGRATNPLTRSACRRFLRSGVIGGRNDVAPGRHGIRRRGRRSRGDFGLGARSRGRAGSRAGRSAAIHQIRGRPDRRQDASR
jgi:NAD(P)-dependent dehydrogenase (short-subunit alcohol dehydrogenase family)